MALTTKNRNDLKSYFVKNAIPTQGNFADLIESQLNQSDDGVFKMAGEPLSVVAASGEQKRVLRFYSSYPAANPDWLISLNPAQEPGNASTNRLGFGIADGAGNTRLFINAAGNLGLGTNDPQGAIDVRVGGSPDPWHRLVVTTTNAWGGSRGYVTIGAGGADGIMFSNPHVAWHEAENRASIRYGRISGKGGETWWDVGARPDGSFALDANENGGAGADLLRVTKIGNVGVGTNNPQKKLDINGDVRAVGNMDVTGTVTSGALRVNGVITPSTGNSETAGIVFPPDPFGGAANSAWIRYHNARGDGKGTLEIGIANDTEDHIVLNSSGNVGIGLTDPKSKLDVAGSARVHGDMEVTGMVKANRIRGHNTLILDNYQTVNPASNVFLHAPPNDRDAWIYLDSAVTGGSNWGIYHRQINSAVAGLPPNSIGFVGGGQSKLQAYVGLQDGAGFFAGKLEVGGAITPSAGNTETAGIMFPPDPFGGSGDRAWIRYHNARGGEKGTLEIGIANDGDDHIVLNASGNVGVGVANPSSKLDIAGNLHINGDVAIRGKHAFRGNDDWLRLNQDGAFSAGVHAASNFTSIALNVGGVNGWGNPGWGNAWFSGSIDVRGDSIFTGKVGIGVAPFVGQVGDKRGVGLNVGGSILLDDTLASTGRMHLYGPEQCVLLHKNGVSISKAWGGNGNLFVEGAKNFRIDHPLDPKGRYLVHSAIEGPEAAVFYRGEAQLGDGICEVTLPHYFEALTRRDNRTVQITPRLVDAEGTSALAASSVVEGRFLVRAIDGRNPSQRFYWEVKAVRADIELIDVEPLKSDKPPV
jgi:hypothetical protein